MDQDRLASSLRNLDPASRALLDLSFRQGVSAQEIADLLGTQRADVRRRGREVVERLAAEHGVSPSDMRGALASLPDRGWSAVGAEPGGGRPTVPEPAAEEERGEDPRPAARPPRRAAARVAAPAYGRHPPQRSRGGFIALSLFVVLAGVAVGIALATGERTPPIGPTQPAGQPPGTSTAPADETGTTEEEPAAEESATEEEAGGASAPEEPAAEEEPAAARQRLEPVGGGGQGVRASAALSGEGEDARLDLRVRGLPKPDGAYQVWLYNSVSDAVPLGSFSEMRTDIDLRLPEDPAGYRFVDISLEPKDGNDNHSGRTVLRVPVERLAGGGG